MCEHTVSLQRTSNAIFTKAACPLPVYLWSMATCINETVPFSNNQEKAVLKMYEYAWLLEAKCFHVLKSRSSQTVLSELDGITELLAKP